MKLQLKPFLTAALFVLGGLSTPALSQGAGWFVGLGAGATKFDDACPGGAVAGFTCDDNGTSWRAFGGYQFNENFGYELGYANLGKTTQSTAGVSSDSFETVVYEASLVITLPINQWYAVYGKWGVYRWELDRTTTGTVTGTANSSGTDTTVGLGMAYNFNKKLALKLEWQRYLDAGFPNAFGTTNVDDYSVRLVFKF